MTIPWGPDDYDFAHAVVREQSIRRKQILPRPDHPEELRWAEEGDKPIPELDTVRSPPRAA